MDTPRMTPTEARKILSQLVTTEIADALDVVYSEPVQANWTDAQLRTWVGRRQVVDLVWRAARGQL